MDDQMTAVAERMAQLEDENARLRADMAAMGQRRPTVIGVPGEEHAERIANLQREISVLRDNNARLTAEVERLNKHGQAEHPNRELARLRAFVADLSTVLGVPQDLPVMTATVKGLAVDDARHRELVRELCQIFEADEGTALSWFVGAVRTLLEHDKQFGTMDKKRRDAERKLASLQPLVSVLKAELGYRSSEEPRNEDIIARVRLLVEQDKECADFNMKRRETEQALATTKQALARVFARRLRAVRGARAMSKRAAHWRRVARDWQRACEEMDAAAYAVRRAVNAAAPDAISDKLRRSVLDVLTVRRSVMYVLKDRAAAQEFADKLGSTETREREPHYQSEAGIECFDAMRACSTPEQWRGFLRMTAFKYLWRAGREVGPGQTMQEAEREDIRKARIYLQVLAEDLGKADG